MIKRSINEEEIILHIYACNEKASKFMKKILGYKEKKACQHL